MLYCGSGNPDLTRRRGGGSRNRTRISGPGAPIRPARRPFPPVGRGALTCTGCGARRRAGTGPGGAGRLLVPIELPPLTGSELRRLFLRLPALRALPQEDRTFVAPAIGGHPRLIEFVDALLRGGRTELRDTARRLRALAREHQLDLRRPRALDDALDDAVLLGAADILLTDLTGLLTSDERDLLGQASVCRSPLTIDDLAYACAGSEPTPGQVAGTARNAARLVDLTLLSHDAADRDSLVMHPWTAAALTRTVIDPGELGQRHRHAVDMHLRRFTQRRAGYQDLVDLARHLAELNQYDEPAALAAQATDLLPGSIARASYLADIRPLLPPDQRPAMLVADLDLQAVLATGNLSALDQVYRCVSLVGTAEYGGRLSPALGGRHRARRRRPGAPAPDHSGRRLR